MEKSVEMLWAHLRFVEHCWRSSPKELEGYCSVIAHFRSVVEPLRKGIENGRQRMSRIAERMHSTSATMGPVDRSVRMGYVKRFHCAEDRRMLSLEEQRTWLKIYRGILDSCSTGRGE